jgi:hypothetical protein
MPSEPRRTDALAGRRILNPNRKRRKALSAAPVALAQQFLHIGSFMRSATGAAAATQHAALRAASAEPSAARAALQAFGQDKKAGLRTMRAACGIGQALATTAAGCARKRKPAGTGGTAHGGLKRYCPDTDGSASHEDFRSAKQRTRWRKVAASPIKSELRPACGPVNRGGAAQVSGQAECRDRGWVRPCCGARAAAGRCSR